MRQVLLAALSLTELLAANGSVHFENIAAKAGLNAAIPNGGETSKKHIIETTGSGVGLIDYDDDGLLDIFLVSGEGGSNRLYRNTGNLKFKDVTRDSGLESTGWGQGVCAGDYDNDSRIDLFVTYWGQSVLYRNIDGKRFADVTKRATLIQPRVRYNTGCAFFDYDRDGDLDLFVANYLNFDFETTPKPGENPYCFYRNLPVACGPRGLPFESQILYRNEGDGTFRDVSDVSGVTAANRNYGLGVAAADFDGDGWTDIYVACDRTPSLLFINQRDGTFAEEALLRGAALDENGAALSGMGVAVADYNNDGRLDIFRSNFSDERATLYRNRGDGDFDEATTGAGMGHNTRFVGWGAGFLDIDNDAFPDLLLVNGHVFPEVERLKSDIRYKERAILYHNSGDGRFEDISERAGPGIAERHTARGLALGDLDNDGAVEAVINSQNEKPALLKLAGKPSGNWVIVKLTGNKSNRSAIGAKVRLTANGRTQIQQVMSGGSYLSQNDIRLHFGLGSAAKIDKLEIEWPNASKQPLPNTAVNRVIHVREE